MPKHSEQAQKILQDRFIDALKKTLCNITAACEASGVGRTTYYRWVEDPEFKARVDEIGEVQIDFVEAQLLKRIKEGSDSSIQFYLKSRGKKRGYGIEESNNNLIIKVKINDADKCDEDEAKMENKTDLEEPKMEDEIVANEKDEDEAKMENKTDLEEPKMEDEIVANEKDEDEIVANEKDDDDDDEQQGNNN